MPEWQYDRMAVWQNGSMAEWQYGRMEVWQNGSMAEWKYGRIWKNRSKNEWLNFQNAYEPCQWCKISSKLLKLVIKIANKVGI